jgi:hypothetical protein
MALQLNLSKIEHKEEALLDPSYVGVLERGMVMVFAGTASASGNSMVTPSTGASGESVAGILLLSETNQADVPTFEQLDIPAVAPLVVTLRKLPLALSTIKAVNRVTGAAITVVAGAPGAGQLGIVLATGVLTADAALAGVKTRVTYRYAISAQELQRRGGRRSINMGAETQFSQVTLCKGKVDLLTSCFDTAQAYDASSAGAALRCGAAGRLTTAGSGTVVGRCSANVALHQTPGITQAFIGCEADLN